MPTAPEVVRALVGGRLRNKLRTMFATATLAQFVNALQYYSPRAD
jgi:hypothetical protein